MSLRLQSTQSARLAPKLLGDSSTIVRGFFLAHQNPDGGFRDRGGKSDVYYTAFALGGLAALADEASARESERECSLAVSRAKEYLRTLGEGESLDFVHLCCLARSWSVLPGLGADSDLPTVALPILRRIETFRAADGGYSPTRSAATGTAYGAFLACGAYLDLGRPLPEPERIGLSVQQLATNDGGYMNDRAPRAAAQSLTGIRTPKPGTNSTAAAVCVLHQVGARVSGSSVDWLLTRVHPRGGFTATAAAQLPDLLSTATALQALAVLPTPLEGVREKCLDFIDTLWTNEGGFYGHWADDRLDCEYTYYALLALGHLALAESTPA